MEDQKFQELILKQLELLTNNQNEMQKDIAELRQRIVRMEEKVDVLNWKQQTTKKK